VQRRAFLMAALLAGCSRKREETKPVDKKPREESAREEAAIIQLVQESQRLGIAGQDLAAFMRIWAEDARLVLGRSAKPGPYDEVIPIDRVEAYWNKRGPDQRSKVELSFARETARITGRRAEVTWDTTIRETHNATKRVAVRVERERWLLRRTDEGWRVYENRVWPVSLQRGAEPLIVYDDAKWAALDRAVDTAKKAGGSDALLTALYAANRFGEGHDAAVKATTGSHVTAVDWFWRAAFAMNLYFIDDAKKSFAHQLELDESAEIPGWARRAMKRAPAAPDAPR
jgi:hypothetical protein